MTILKCKMCGGNIMVTGESHGVCDSCGCEVTLPKIDDDKRAEMYNRGNFARRNGDFDKAYSAYEHIIADDSNDAEAHWCLTLCRYGIEYVQDPRTGDYKPTCSRINYTPILDDPDYLAALKNSDEYTKELYRKEAHRIADIQNRYITIAQKEEPYDVFICFKATDANGKRTQDSVIAQDIYEKLTEKGLKVFFSRITLVDKAGEAYEPYIFAALNSAKVMLVVTTKKDNLEARWVRNEWSRYVAMMERDKNKHIIPVFQGMDPNEFPMEIPTFQGIDMGQIGAMQDLVRGVLKLTGRLNPNPTSAMNYDRERSVPLSEAEKRVDGEELISNVKSIGSLESKNLWVKGTYSSVIDMDEYPVVAFHIILKYAYRSAMNANLGYAIYDELNNQICKTNYTIPVKDGNDRFACCWILRGTDGSSVQPGLYRAEFWVDDSRAFTYQFRVTSRRIAGLPPIQRSVDEIEQKKKEDEVRRAREEATREKRQAKEKAIATMRENVGSPYSKYLFRKLEEKDQKTALHYRDLAEKCQKAERRAPVSVVLPMSGMIMMVVCILGILFAGNWENFTENGIVVFLYTFWFLGIGLLLPTLLGMKAGLIKGILVGTAVLMVGSFVEESMDGRIIPVLIGMVVLTILLTVLWLRK